MDNTVETGEHLALNRPQILWRSLLVGLCGVIPLPVLDDTLAEGLRRGLLRRIAQSRQVDIDETALDVLSAASPQEESTSLGLTAALGSALAFLRRRRWPRRLLAALTFLRQVGEAERLFEQATLFDHYCARHHVGPGIDGAAALALRACFDEVGRTSQREALGEAFERALTAGQSAARAVPARLSRLLGRGRPEEVAPEPTQAVETPTFITVMHNGSRRLLRDVALHRYSRRLISAFDRRWQERAHSADRPPSR